MFTRLIIYRGILRFSNVFMTLVSNRSTTRNKEFYTSKKLKLRTSKKFAEYWNVFVGVSWLGSTFSLRFKASLQLFVVFVILFYEKL